MDETHIEATLVALENAAEQLRVAGNSIHAHIDREDVVKSIHAPTKSVIFAINTRVRNIKIAASLIEQIVDGESAYHNGVNES